MIKYRINFSDYDCTTDIKEVEIERETEKSVWLPFYGREAKRSTWHNYFDTWEEAKAQLEEWQTARVERVKKTLEVAKSKLDNIRGLSC